MSRITEPFVSAAASTSTDGDAARHPRNGSTRPLRVLYAAGPGDVAGTFLHWLAGRDDPSQVAVTYSAMFFDLCREHGVQAYIVTTHPRRTFIERGDFRIEHRPRLWRGRGGVRYHLSQVLHNVSLVITAARFHPDVALVADTTHWYALWPMKWLGVRVVPALHGAFWAAGARPTGKIRRIIDHLNGLFWRRIPHATICISPECERQIHALTAKPRGQMIQARPLYRQQTFKAEHASACVAAATAAMTNGKMRMTNQITMPQCPNLNIDSLEFHSSFEFSHSSLPSGVFQIVFAGRIEPAKGVFDLFELACRLQQSHPGRFHWRICGGGSALQQLRTMTHEANMTEHFDLPGKLERPAMVAAYAASHAVIVPTTTAFAEGLNKVAVEAVLAGRPVILTAAAHAAELLGDAAVFVHPPTVANYARAVLDLAGDAEAYRRRCRACIAASGPFYDPMQSWQSAVGKALEDIGRR